MIAAGARSEVAHPSPNHHHHTKKNPNPPQEKFTGRYEASEAAVTAQLRDLPPVAGKVLWARQIERELRRLVKRVEDVLGPG